MNRKEYEFTASEINQLEYILSIMPPDRVVERIGLERRLEKGRQRLEGVAIPPRPVKVDLAFQGRPVADGDGVEANFAGKTAATFTDYTALEVAGDTRQLYDTGGIPRRGLGQQRISGVTKGSFGFEIELLPPTGAEERQGHTDNPAERAVTALQDLLEVSLEGTDEELATLKDQMHPRAFRKATELIELLRTNQAQMAIGFRGREVALRNPGEVEDVAKRLAGQETKDETNTVNGTLIGMVPTRRFFEFQVSNSGENIEGRIGREITDPYRIAARYTNEEVRARIRQIQVGQGEAKYTLLEILGPVDGSPSL